MKPLLKNRAGFTLLELLLALAIFSIIGITTVKYIQLIQNTKETAFEDLDLYNSIRAALSVIRNDLNQAFHVLYDDLGEENKQAILQNQQVPHTIFDGRKSEIIFTSLSHRNYYAGRKESEQTEISYFMFQKQGFKNPSLMKRESELIDKDLYQGGSIFTLIDDVAEVQFKYWDEKVSRWVDDWSSDAGAYRDRFPYAVKVKLTVLGPRNQKVVVDTQFKISFPNNDAQLVQLQ